MRKGSTDWKLIHALGILNASFKVVVQTGNQMKKLKNPISSFMLLTSNKINSICVGDDNFIVYGLKMSVFMLPGVWNNSCLLSWSFVEYGWNSYTLHILPFWLLNLNTVHSSLFTFYFLVLLLALWIRVLMQDFYKQPYSLCGFGFFNCAVCKVCWVEAAWIHACKIS